VKRVLCVGIATLDQVFRVQAMPTRAEKYRAQDLVVTGGGTAANGAVAIARLGGAVSLYAVLGDDPVGDAILAGLEREKVDCSAVRRLPGLRSPLSAIMVDEAGERMIVSYADPHIPGPPSWLPARLPEGVDAVLGDTRWQTGSAHFFRLARAAGVPAVLDADRAPQEVPELLALATHVAFSMQGLGDLTGIGEPRAALAAFGAGNAWLGVTDGAAGVYHWAKGAIAHDPAFAVEALDTLGAGDTWHGGFALGLAEGMTEPTAIRFASAAAALKCTRFGGREGMPHRAEVERLLSQDPRRAVPALEVRRP
jgi:sulfofructose kinase